MKNKIFNLFKGLFVEQIKAFALSNFPLQQTTQIEKYTLIKVKKGKLRQWRLYDKEHKRMHDFKVASNGKININH